MTWLSMVTDTRSKVIESMVRYVSNVNWGDSFSLKIETGEEIFVSYGNHSNDFLLVECAKHNVPTLLWLTCLLIQL